VRVGKKPNASFNRKATGYPYPLSIEDK